MIERRIEQLQLSPAERAEFERGMRDYRNRAQSVALLDVIPRIQSFQREREDSAFRRALAESDEFLRAAASEPDAEQLPSGIVLRLLEKGEGVAPKPSERAIVRAEGTLPDGLVFFSSEREGRPFSVDMSTGIPCLTEPLARLAVGSRARITCPPQSGYAVQDQSRPVLITPGSALRFELELVEVKPSLANVHPH